MPFQSEKQRRYLWANEPEIARDWTNTYGNRIQKNDGGIMHHFQNYAQNDGNNVSVPRSFQARPHSEQVNLAYITPQEQQMLQALKPGTPHRGPMEIPNYDSFDAQGNYGTSQQHDAPTAGDVRAGVGSTTGGGAGDTRIATIKQDIRDVNRGIRPAGYNVGQFQPSHRLNRSGIGGFFGGLGRGLLSFFGGIPGKLMSGIMTAKDWATKKGQNIGQGVQTFAEYPTLDRWLNRNTDKYLNKPYRGQGYGYDFNEDTSRRIVKDPDLYADQMKEFRMRYPLDVSKYNQGIAGTQAYEDFSPNVALSKMLANPDQLYEEFRANQLAERDFPSDEEIAEERFVGLEHMSTYDKVEYNALKKNKALGIKLTPEKEKRLKELQKKRDTKGITEEGTATV